MATDTRRNLRHADRLTQLARASMWETDPAAIVAVARSIYSHLPESGAPLWLGVGDVGRETPAAVLAALAV
jgi:hypothetical protein